MPNYKELYFMLFAAAADAVEYLEQGQPFLAKERLIRAQQEAEERYLKEESQPQRCKTGAGSLPLL